MSSWIDITYPLSSKLALWPGSEPFQVHPGSRISKGETTNTSGVSLDLHMGSHLDAPWHMLDHGKSVDTFPLETLIGPAQVVEFPDIAILTAPLLKSAGLESGLIRLLIKTRNSHEPTDASVPFRTDFTALDESAARLLVDYGIKLVGIDGPSIEPFRSPGHPVHLTFMKAETAIVEGLNLSEVTTGYYDLVCLPLPLIGLDASPVRACVRSRL